MYSAIAINTRVSKEDWSPYDLTNDASIRPGTDYTEWNKLAVWIGDRWVYGSILLSYADWMEPNPEEDKEVTYPSDAMESYEKSMDKAGNTTAYTYDSSGNITSVVDALGNKVSYIYDKMGIKSNARMPTAQLPKPNII